MSGVAEQYLTRYPIALPDPTADALVAHQEAWAGIQAMAGRRMDGYLLYQHVKGGGLASDGITGLKKQDRDALNALGTRLTTWFDQLIARCSPRRRGSAACRCRAGGRSRTAAPTSPR